MPMKIKQISDYCWGTNGSGITSPKNAGNSVADDNNSSYDSPEFCKEQYKSIEPQIKVILASNYQIFAYAYPNTVKIQVRNKSVITRSDQSSIAYLYTFKFDNESDLNIIEDTLTQSDLSNIASTLSSTTLDKMFVIVAINQSAMDQVTTASILTTAGDFNASSTIGAIASYVAVGFNRQIIDSMVNGGGKSGPSQLFVNGKNIAPENTFVAATATTAAYMSFTEQKNVDYFVLRHSKVYATTDRYIIKNHKVSVWSDDKTEIVLKQPSHDFIETFHGARYYLFESIGERRIDSGYVSAISMYGTQAALSRGVVQDFNPFFYEDDVSKNSTTTDVNQIISKITAFTSTQPSNYDYIKQLEYETAIKNMAAISYGKTSCINSTCSFQCKNSCEILCKVGCGVKCQDTCANRCNNSCGRSNCNSNCGGDCKTTCKNGCSGTCLGVCSGTCGAGTCDGSCGTGTCTANCQYWCSGGCVSGDSSNGGCGTNCWGKCDSGCKHGCNGKCSSCYNSCSGRCAGACSGGGCSATCSNSCANTCKQSCWSTCNNVCSNGCAGGVCAFTCTLQCSEGCSILCQDSCSGSCSGSCSNSCVATSGNIPYL